MKSSTSITPSLKSRHKSVTSSARIKSMIKAEEQIEVMVVVPPDGGWGWVVVFAAFYCNFVNDGVNLSFGIFLDTYVKEFNSTKAGVSISASIFSGCSFLLGPLTSGVANRYGFRICTVIGGLLSGSGYALTSLRSNTLPLMYLFHGCMGGIGSGFVLIPATLAVGFYFEKWRALATGIAVSASGIGTIVWPILIESLLHRCDWRTVLCIIGSAEATCAIAGLLFRPLKPQRVTVRSKSVDTYSLISFKSQPSSEKPGCCHRCIICRRNPTYYPTALEAIDANRESLLLLPDIPRMSTISDTSIFDSELLKFEPSKKSIASAMGRSTLEFDESEITCCERFQVEVLDRICFCCKSKANTISAQRPLYRDDIFFHASLMHLPNYAASVADTRSLRPGTSVGQPTKSTTRADYHAGVSRVATHRDVHYEQYLCRVCPQAMTRVMSMMLDVSLLKSPSFLLLAIGSFITLMGVQIPYVFLISRGEEHNLSRGEANAQLSLIGVSNTIGRISCGLVASIPKLNALIVSYFSLIMCGSIFILNECYDAKYMQYSTALIWGLFSSCIAALRPLVIIDLLSLDRLTNAFGLLMVFQGLGIAVGVPFAGLLRDRTGTYRGTFLFSAIVTLIGGILLIPLKKIKKWEINKEKTTSHV